MEESATRLVTNALREDTGRLYTGQSAAGAERYLAQGLKPLLQAPVAVQPLLRLQNLVHEGQSAVAICGSVRSAQRHCVEFARASRGRDRIQVFALHEQMPPHQQDFVVEALEASPGTIEVGPAVVFTTAAYYPELMQQLPWLDAHAEIVTCGTAAQQADAGPPPPVVSCICLREGKGGRWVLSDHDDAAVVPADRMPADDLIPRLLRHCVDLSGADLAPYLATAFDVPAPWKKSRELSTKSLLIFRRGRCATGCNRPGIPTSLVWIDKLGLIY